MTKWRLEKNLSFKLQVKLLNIFLASVLAYCLKYEYNSFDRVPPHQFDVLNGGLAWNVHLDVDTSGQQKVHSDLVRCLSGQRRVGCPHVQEVCHGRRHGKGHNTPPQP